MKALNILVSSMLLWQASVVAFAPKPQLLNSLAAVPNSPTIVSSLKSPLFHTRTIKSLYSTATASASGDSLLQNDIAPTSPTTTNKLTKLQFFLTKFGMMAFVLSMCIALPATLLPQKLLRSCGLLDRVQSEQLALWTGQFCARWLMRVFPFCTIKGYSHHDPNPQPSVWVCNHTSMLDVFVLLAMDRKLRGKKKRPIKIVYWKQLEDNPVTKLLFRQCGFIPVDMENNGNGNANEYDRASFKSLLQKSKQAFSDGFDIALLPEGQLNPHPEQGLLPVFSGAYTLAKMAKRPIGIMAMHGVHTLWHPIHGMEPTGNKISAQVYPHPRIYNSADEFTTTFSHVVGEFGKSGTNVKDLDKWLDGSAYKEMMEPTVTEDMDTSSNVLDLDVSGQVSE